MSVIYSHAAYNQTIIDLYYGIIIKFKRVIYQRSRVSRLITVIRKKIVRVVRLNPEHLAPVLMKMEQFQASF